MLFNRNWLKVEVCAWDFVKWTQNQYLPTVTVITICLVKYNDCIYLLFVFLGQSDVKWALYTLRIPLPTHVWLGCNVPSVSL